MATYQKHPSERLQRLFSDQEFPHQGQDQRLAKVIFIGQDANYPTDLSDGHPFFERIIEYHQDSVAFWQKHGVHHPFLLAEYPFKKNTGGVPYHRKFGSMGLTTDYAQHISFIELLDVATIGSTDPRLFWRIFNTGHAERIDQIVTDGSNRLVIINSTLMQKYMMKARKNFGAFRWLPDRFKLGQIALIGNTAIYGARHFSSSVSNEELTELGYVVRDFCDR